MANLRTTRTKVKSLSEQVEEFVIDKIFKKNKGKDVDSVSFPEGVELFPEKEDEEKENEYDQKLKKMLEKESQEEKNEGDDNDAVAS